MKSAVNAANVAMYQESLNVTLLITLLNCVSYRAVKDNNLVCLHWLQIEYVIWI